MAGGQAVLGGVVREGKFGKREADDKPGQPNRLQIPAIAAFLEVGSSQNPLLILDR